MSKIYFFIFFKVFVVEVLSVGFGVNFLNLDFIFVIYIGNEWFGVNYLSFLI